MRKLSCLLVTLLVCFPTVALAAGTIEGGSKQAVNWAAIGMFLGFVSLTLAITYWASKRTVSAADFYSAGGGITAGQNGLAIAGDYMSAASFLGIPIGTGVMTIGIPIGLLVIVSAFLLTGIYVSKAASQYDPLVRKIIGASRS